MHDLLFAAPGDRYPVTDSVTAAWKDEWFEFRLLVERGLLRTTDRCYDANADAVLLALVGEV